MPTIAVHTLGCKVNQYDSEAMLESFEKAGYESVPFDQDADVYLVNTCTVTGTGDKKSMQIIRRCHRQNRQIPLKDICAMTAGRPRETRSGFCRRSAAWVTAQQRWPRRTRIW